MKLLGKGYLYQFEFSGGLSYWQVTVLHMIVAVSANSRRLTYI